MSSLDVDFGVMAEREMRRHLVCGSSAGWDIDLDGCSAPLSHELCGGLAATAAERDRLREAAQRLLDGQYSLAIGTADGPDPGPEDFTPYVRREDLVALRAALAPGTAVDVE